jgi:NAD(P)H-hydrate epimerase
MDPEAHARPKPSAFAHKGENGRVLVVGGSEAFSGAPLLSALGALRAGAGLVTIACPATPARTIPGGWPEIMRLPLGDNTVWNPEMFPALRDAAAGMQEHGALVVGPGLGREKNALALACAVVQLSRRPPLLLDADALFPLTPGRPEADTLWAALREEDILTPHPGEAARLLGWTAEEVQQERAAALRSLTARSPATVVLKGPGTLVGQGNKPVALLPFAVPALAAGGSGDVLAGVCAAFLAVGHRSFTAACLGVYLHGKAGQLLETRFPYRGNLARDLADALPDVRW